MVFRIKLGEQFRFEYTHLEKGGKQRVDAFIEQLKINPQFIGKPLGYKFFREKRFNGKRLYFLVYEEWNIVFIVRLSGKKDQQEAIDWVLANLSHFREYIENIRNQ